MYNINNQLISINTNLILFYVFFFYYIFEFHDEIKSIIENFILMEYEIIIIY